MQNTKQETFTPAKKTLYLAILLVMALGIAAFTLLLRASFRNIRPIDANDYQLSTPDKFYYNCTVKQSNGAYSLRGYAFIEGERFFEVDTRACLRHIPTDSYWQLPSDMELNPDAVSAVNDGVNYSFGGFTSFVITSQLQYKPSEYEICFLYRSNGYNLLIQTGDMLTESLL